MVEKPMAMNPKECQRMMMRLEKREGSRWGFSRYHPSTQFLCGRAMRAVWEGDVCEVSGAAPARIPNWGVFGQKKLQGAGR